MRGERSEVAVVALVMAAAGLILLAPLLGRSGSPGWADVVMGLAAAAGLAAFLVVAVQTCRAALRPGDGGKGGKL
jgi:hypothetical protein